MGAAHPVRAQRTFFELPTVKTAGIAAFCLFLGLAIGNGIQTSEAMTGQAQWFRGWCGRQVQSTVRRHEALDRQVFGFTAEDVAGPAPKKD